jgi:mycofactocin biosynthesis protein MftB
VAFDPTLGYRLHANVALRPEPFGALAYHYGNRKLVFLKSPRMVSLVRSLHDFGSIELALTPLNLSVRAHENYLNALRSLESSDMIVLQQPISQDASLLNTVSQQTSQESADATIG